MPSPYRFGPTPPAHAITASAVAGLALYVAVASLALYEGLFRVPSGEAGIFGAARVLREPLTATRAAALSHAGIALVANLAGRSLWGPWRGGSRSGRAIASPRQPSRALAATAWALGSLASGAVVWTAVAACFGVGALRKPTETAHLGLLLSSLTVVPGAAMYGCAQEARWEWHRVLVLGDGAFYPRDFVWFGGAWGAALGAWAGAVAVPLDWGRDWQAWPITCVVGAAGGHAVGSVLGVLYAAMTGWRRARKTKGR